MTDAKQTPTPEERARAIVLEATDGDEPYIDSQNLEGEIADEIRAAEDAARREGAEKEAEKNAALINECAALRLQLEVARHQAFREAAQVDPLEVECPECGTVAPYPCAYDDLCCPERWRAAIKAKGESR